MLKIDDSNEFFKLEDVKAGQPQRSVLGPILYLPYTCEIPAKQNVTVASFADDSALIDTERDSFILTDKIQSTSNRLLRWTNSWKIK